MRQVTVTAPAGKGPEVAQIAFSVGIRDVSLSSIRALKSRETERPKDHLEVETATHLAKAFVEKLTTSSFFNTEEYAITVRQPRSVYSTRSIQSLTRPLVEPTSDLFQELWQFSQITFGFIGRIYLGAVLLAFGLVDYRLLFIIAGLLFIPLLPLMLGIGFSLWTRQWKLLAQSGLALVAATILMAAGGVTVAFFSQPPIRYVEANSLLTGFVVSLVVGVAAGLATSDDVGRREMIGLAATAQVAIVPTWFGLATVLGLPANVAVSAKQRAVSLVINVAGIIIASFVTYAALRMRGESLRAFTVPHEKS
ncbi:MAG TPA: hypothetical protein VN696_02595 [Pyrinomonadaceae bacterium]|nr:hypothetical protein [Pyrinomonadaceae bacterium]